MFDTVSSLSCTLKRNFIRIVLAVDRRSTGKDRIYWDSSHWTQKHHLMRRVRYTVHLQSRIRNSSHCIGNGTGSRSLYSALLAHSFWRETVHINWLQCSYQLRTAEIKTALFPYQIARVRSAIKVLAEMRVRPVLACMDPEPFRYTVEWQGWQVN